MNEPHELYPRLPYLGKPYENLSIWLATLPEAEQWHWLAFQPARLMAENAITRYYLLVTNFEFIEAKLKLIGIMPLLRDYDLGIINCLITTEVKLYLILVKKTVEQLGKIYQEYPALYAQWTLICKMAEIAPHETIALKEWLQWKHPDFAAF